MRKVLGLLTAAIGLGLGVHSAVATTIGPDSFGYIATDNTAYPFVDITGTGTKVLTGTDDGTFFVSPITAFSFYGTSYTSVYLSSNGLLSFGAAQNGYSNSDITANQVSGQPVILPFWDDLITHSAEGVYYQQTGSRFIVQAIEEHYSGSPGTANFETILDSSNGSILFNYANPTFGTADDNGASATIGIQGNLQIGQDLQWDFNGTRLVVGGESICIGIAGVACGTTATPVPEPGTLTVLGMGLLALGGLRRRRIKKTP